MRSVYGSVVQGESLGDRETAKIGHEALVVCWAISGHRKSTLARSVSGWPWLKLPGSGQTRSRKSVLAIEAPRVELRFGPGLLCISSSGRQEDRRQDRQRRPAVPKFINRYGVFHGVRIGKKRPLRNPHIALSRRHSNGSTTTKVGAIFRSKLRLTFGCKRRSTHLPPTAHYLNPPPRISFGGFTANSTTVLPPRCSAFVVRAATSS